MARKIAPPFSEWKQPQIGMKKSIANTSIEYNKLYSILILAFTFIDLQCSITL